MKINTGNSGSITLIALIAIYSISMVISLPGLAISPILGKLETIFKDATQFDLQLLASISSFVIIPFVLLSGKLSISKDKKTILIFGLILFFLSSLLYLFANTISALLWISVILGIGAGMVIPLSKGLIAIYFSGSERQKQLGISSGVTNVSLVAATLLTGFLADIDWHYSFLVYSLSLVALILAFTLKTRGKQANPPITASDTVSAPTLIHVPHQEPIMNPETEVFMAPHPVHADAKFKTPIALMFFYFAITIIALAIPIELALFVQNYNIGNSGDTGVVIALFFLAMTIPGFTINFFIRQFKTWVNIFSIFLMLLGLGTFLLSQNMFILTLGSILVGLGYGIMQPIIYEKAVAKVSASHATFSLSLVMTMNYVAIILYPLIVNITDNMGHTISVLIPFALNFTLCLLLLIWGLFRKNHEIFGMNSTY